MSPPPVRHYEPWRIYVSIIAVIYGALRALCSTLIPDSGTLVLDDEGFGIKSYLGKIRRRAWMGTNNFRVEERNTFVSVVVYDDAVQAHTKSGEILSALRGQKSPLYDRYDLTPETLALLMTQWRELALQH
jgi:hypothetical protein